MIIITIQNENEPKMNLRQYQILEAMKIPIWVPKTKELSTEKVIIGASCLVILPKNPRNMPEAEKKIFQGMLSVLNLSKNQLAIAWTGSEDAGSTPSAIGQTLKAWLPYTILIMGEGLANQLTGTKANMDTLRKEYHALPFVRTWVQITYHPQELLEHPNNKAKAYQDLLEMKQKLSRVAV